MISASTPTTCLVIAAVFIAREKGEQKGIHQGIIKIVAMQLKLLFGPVPEWVQERLANASEGQLSQWAGEILTVQSLSDLFRADGPVH